MRRLLLSLLALLPVYLMAGATTADGDLPPVFNSDRSISDPNGDHTPDEALQFVRDYIQDNYIAKALPSPLDADFYLDLFNENKLIPLVYNDAEGLYSCTIPVLRGEWKIYSKEYFETTESDRNQYIWGTSEQYAPAGCGGSAYYINDPEWRKMAHPGANCTIQIPQGSSNQNRVYYNCLLRFRSDISGSNWNGAFIMTGTQAGSTPAIKLEAVGKAISSFAGNVDFTIIPVSVYEPEQQTYTVVMTYTDRYGDIQSMETTITGLTGTFKNVAVLKSGDTTQCTLNATGYSLPVYNNNGEVADEKQDLSNDDPAYADITTMAEPYIIGSIKNIDWSPVKLLTQIEDTAHPGYTKSIGAGTPLCEVAPHDINAYTTLVWEDVQFTSDGTNTSSTDVMRYRFITSLPASESDSNPWGAVNKGIQYFPKPGEVFAPNTVACITDSSDKSGAGTQEAFNMISSVMLASGSTQWVQKWYDASSEVVSNGVQTAWRADNKNDHGQYLLPGSTSAYGDANEKLAYYVYLDVANGSDGGARQAIYWAYTSDPTDVEDVSVDAPRQSPDVVDVYNMQGCCVRRGVAVAEALDNLPTGIYVYGGHKYMVR